MWTTTPRRAFASSSAVQKITSLLQRHLKNSHVIVEDTSGGCGTMFNIDVASTDFQYHRTYTRSPLSPLAARRGLTTIAQHRKVKDILKDEIPNWHGFLLQTRKRE